LIRQIPVFPPEHYTSADLSFIVPRVLELTYTARDLTDWAKSLGFDGPPFAFDPDRRAILRAELDAYYARLYGLTHDELRYILDPADVMGDDYPSETFRVLKNKERIPGTEHYRTQQLVLAAWDALEVQQPITTPEPKPVPQGPTADLRRRHHAGVHSRRLAGRLGIRRAATSRAM
jgi:hypothetical protein